MLDTLYHQGAFIDVTLGLSSKKVADFLKNALTTFSSLLLCFLLAGLKLDVPI